MSDTTHFETDVLKVVLLVGLIRSIIELFTNPATTTQFDVALDLGYFTIFVLGSLILFSGANRSFLLVGFYFPLVTLLAITLFERGGLSASSEHNIYAGILVLCMTLRGKAPLLFTTLLVFLTMCALVTADLLHPDAQNISQYSESMFNFNFMTLGVIALIFFAKRNFDKKRAGLLKAQVGLYDMNNQIKGKQEQIEEQNAALEKLNNDLEKEITDQIAKLEQQKAIMNQYLQITVNELLTNHEKMKQSIDSFSSKTKMDEMIQSSALRLEEEIRTLQEKITG